MNIDIYNAAIQDIWTYLLLNMIPILVGGIILTVLALLGLFKKLMKKSVAFIMLTLCVILIAYPIIEIAIFSYDIQHENFAVYYGDFDYMQVSGNRKDVFEISDRSDLYIRSVSDLNISSGSYSGYLLYGKNSRWVIAYSKNKFE